MDAVGWSALVGALVLVAGIGVALRLRRRRAATPGGVPESVERVYTRHVRERMQQRNVSRAQVEATLAGPDRLTHDPVEGSHRFEKAFGDEIVKVWVSDEEWPPRTKVVIKSTAAQRYGSVRVPAAAVGRVIGRGGSTIQQIRRDSGARVDVRDGGLVVIVADTRDEVAVARRMVEAAVRR